MKIQESVYDRESLFSSVSHESSFGLEVEKAMRFAKYDEITILILGETGTGKTCLARTVHEGSPRRHFPFVEIDCTSISPTLAESELFGHIKGSFTGALQDRPGRVRKAHTGTLFLDEIGELDLSIQSKLLKLLEDKIIVPVGSEQPVPVDIRIIAATNRNLESMVSSGKFRRDLYERIRQAMLTLPPLRARRPDIADLLRIAVEEWNRNNKEAKGFDPVAASILLEHSWPGNIRELKNVIKYSCALSNDALITPECLPDYIRFPSQNVEDGSRPGLALIPEEGINLKENLLDIEWSYFKAALIRMNGNSEKAAALLGMSGHTFRKAMRERFSNRILDKLKEE